MRNSDETKALMAALHKIQGKVHGVKRDAKNPHYKSRYATLEQVVDTIRPALQEHGVVFSQMPGSFDGASLMLHTLIYHVDSGQWLASDFCMPLGRVDPQGAGSAITYACRYALMAMLGLPPTDDDANAASSISAVYGERKETVYGERKESYAAASQGAPSPARQAFPNGTSRPAEAEFPVDDSWKGEGDTRLTAAELKRTGTWQLLKADVDNATNLADLDRAGAAWKAKAVKANWPPAWKYSASEAFAQRRSELTEALEPEESMHSRSEA